MPQSPAVVFDFGNVVAFFDYRRACEALSRELNLEIDCTVLMTRALDRGFGELLIEFEHGRIEDNFFSTRLLEILELPMTVDRFRPAWADIFWLNEPVVGLIHRIKDAGHRLVLGSNTNAMHATHFLKKFDPVLSRFDGIVLSYQVGEMKPSAVFYRACVEKAGLPAGECIFIDDLADNVAGAQRAGLQAIHYTGDNEALEAQLRDLGVQS